MSFDTAFGAILNRTVIMYEIGGQKIGFIELDATVNESHSRTARVTKNEVEEGGDVTDNVILDNEKFSIEGLISEAPIPSNDIRDLPLTVTNKAFSFLNNAAGAISGGLLKDTGPTLKRITGLIQLENFWKNAIPFRVITGLKKYENVIMTGLTIDVNPKDGKSLRFKMDCEVVRLVESELIAIPESKSTAGASKLKNLGKQGLKNATDAAKNKGSILFNLFAKS